MIDAVLVTVTNIGNHRTFKYVTESVDTVTAGDEVRFDVDPILQGTIIGVNSLCSSTDFTLELHDLQGESHPSVSEIYRVENIDRLNRDQDTIIFKNLDSPTATYVYGSVHNSDSTNATGTVTVEITFA